MFFYDVKIGVNSGSFRQESKHVITQRVSTTKRYIHKINHYEYQTVIILVITIPLNMLKSAYF